MSDIMVKCSVHSNRASLSTEHYYYPELLLKYNMNDILNQLAFCIERGKERRDSRYPPDMREQDGASELCRQALDAGIPAEEVLKRALMTGMRRIGDRFAVGEAFIPELLISAKAMYAAMAHLEPYYQRGEIHRRGVVVIGTVTGDLHDIGKNIVRMVLQGDGWETVDLGVDVRIEQFIEACADHPGSVVALSALLTTTMVNMSHAVTALRERFPDQAVYIGGAPVTPAFAQSIGATGYFPDPHSFARHLETLSL